MAILVDGHSRIIIQGITGRTGRNIAGRWLEEGSPLVGGVSPARAGETVAGLPVLAACHDAVTLLDATASFIAVPADCARDAVLEAIDAGLRTVVVYTEGVPLHDALQCVAYARARGVRLIGPNAAGCISPELANMSDLSAAALTRGRIGIVSKSGTLSYEVISLLAAAGFGQSTVVCLGGDAVLGTEHRDVLELFEADAETDAVVLLGEIGGGTELRAATFVAAMSKPVVAYVVGRHAPPGKRMGHAGALVGSSEQGAAAKEQTLRAAGAIVADDLFAIGDALRAVLGGRRTGTHATAETSMSRRM